MAVLGTRVCLIFALAPYWEKGARGSWDFRLILGDWWDLPSGWFPPREVCCWKFSESFRKSTKLMSAESHSKIHLLMSKLTVDSQISSARVLHATLNDGKIYFKNVQGTSQVVIFFFFFFFGALNIIFCDCCKYNLCSVPRVQTRKVLKDRA